MSGCYRDQFRRLSARDLRTCLAYRASSRSLSATSSNALREICSIRRSPSVILHANGSLGSSSLSRSIFPSTRSELTSSSPYAIACSRLKTKLSKYSLSFGEGVAHSTVHSGLTSCDGMLVSSLESKKMNWDTDRLSDPQVGERRLQQTDRKRCRFVSVTEPLLQAREHYLSTARESRRSRRA